MKYLTLFGFLLLLFFTSCEEPPIVFYEPQPENSKNSKKFTPAYRSMFLCDSDSSIVHIKKRTIFKEKEYEATLAIQDIPSIEELSYENGELRISPLDQVAEVVENGDSLTAKITLRDTLFSIGPKSVLRNYNGHAILNKQLDKEKWEVEILSLDEDYNLRYSVSILPENINDLLKVTATKDISNKEQTQYIIKPSKIEFRELLNTKLIFEECDRFVRIKGSIHL